METDMETLSKEKDDTNNGDLTISEKNNSTAHSSQASQTEEHMERQASKGKADRTLPPPAGAEGSQPTSAATEGSQPTPAATEGSQIYQTKTDKRHPQQKGSDTKTQAQRFMEDFFLISTPTESQSKNNKSLLENVDDSIRDRTPEQSSSKDSETPSSSQRGRSLKKTPAKKPVLHVKKTLTSRRRETSLKRKGDGLTSYFEKKTKNKKNCVKGNLFSVFKTSKVMNDLTPTSAKDGEGLDEKHQIISEILNEILSRINY